MSLKKLIDNYATFNYWANVRIVNWLSAVPVEKMYAPVTSSFASIDYTLQHMLRTQRFWLAFINERDTSGVNWSIRENEADKIMKELVEVSAEMKDTFSAFTQEQLEELLRLDMPWAKNQLSRYEYIVHIVNHGSFHRGQIITIARSIGLIEGVVNTDYNMFHIHR
jgi:uncharacterized damage-inducible protein DinB